MPLYDPAVMRNFCEENAPGLFDLVLKSITREDNRVSAERESMQKIRTVSLIDILSYFRCVVKKLFHSGCYRTKKSAYMY